MYCDQDTLGLDEYNDDIAIIAEIKFENMLCPKVQKRTDLIEERIVL